MNQETRGKDATGIAYIKDNKIHVIKKAVTPTEFKKIVDEIEDSEILIAIGHNRHATSNTEQKHLDSEAHPFISEDGSFAIVHNGSVRAEETIRGMLEIISNHKFSSKVDSEVYVHILEELLKKDKSRVNALEKLYKFSEGNLLVLFSDGELIGIPDKSMVLAKQDDSLYIASTESSLFSVLNPGSFKLARLSFSKESKAVSVRLKKDKKLDVLFYGDWEVESIDAPEGFKIALKTMCDFCRTASVWCEKYPISTDTYKDRCVSCFKQNKTDLPVTQPAVTPPVVYHPAKHYKKKASGYLRCTGYDHMVSLHKILYCCYCGKYYCKGCFRDSRKHECAKKNKYLKGTRAFTKDIGWDMLD